MHVNPRMMAAAGATAAVLVTGLLVVNVPSTVVLDVGQPSYVVGIADGGRMYMQKTGDAGTGWKRVAAGGCVRRKEGGSSALCRRKDPDNAFDVLGLVVGELNRFPAADARPVVNDCEPVACAVFQGEAANNDETMIVNDLLGEILP